jgi:hypothetical protein
MYANNSLQSRLTLSNVRHGCSDSIDRFVGILHRLHHSRFPSTFRSQGTLLSPLAWSLPVSHHCRVCVVSCAVYIGVQGEVG